MSLSSYIIVKKFNEADNLIIKILKLVNTLESESKTNVLIKPRLYLLKAYFCLIKHQTFLTSINIYRAKRFAVNHDNQMDLAWIIQNNKVNQF